jgi:2-dehydropantoate 2-reductase
MTLGSRSSIVIAGAGSVGSYVGGRLTAAGRNVTFLMRKPLAATISRLGLRISDLDQRDQTLPPALLNLTADPEAALRAANVVLVTVKARDTAAMGQQIAQHAPKDAIVVSLQNGVENADVLRKVLGPGRCIVDAMVPFNVVQSRKDGEAPRFHRASSGTMLIESGVDGLRDLLDVQGAPFAEHDDIEAVLWGKLLVNLNNALSALSGLPLIEQLGDRRWRLLLSRQIREGLAVLRAAGISIAPVEGVHPRLTAFALRLPDRLFKLTARRMMAFDRNARSSMWEDLEAGRPTEIDYIQGEIVRQAETHGIEAPLNRRVMQLIKDAEKAGKGSPALSPGAVKGGQALP